MFAPSSSSTISYSRAVTSSPFHSVHKWILVGNTRSAKWLLPAVLQAELTIQKYHPLGVSPLLTPWRRPRCRTFLRAEGRWKEACKKLKSTVNFGICLLIVCKLIFYHKSPHFQDKQTYLVSCGRKEEVRGKKICLITLTRMVYTVFIFFIPDLFQQIAYSFSFLC